MKKILIVEDEPENIVAITDIFEKYKLPYDIINAPNGSIALKLIAKLIPDLIITDWEMPVMDGIEFIANLNNNEETKDIPVIMCTGVMTTSDNLHTALNAGAVDYIRKPIDEIELIARTKANLLLADKHKEIKKLSEMKDKIFSVISHDLRGPVGTIKSFTDIILEDNDSTKEELIKSIKLIGKQSSSVYSILENLLSWARCQRSSISLNMQNQPIINAINDNINLMAEMANKKKIRITNKANENHIASFDIDLISSVVRNLLNNAIKFTPIYGEITITTKEDEQYSTFIINDTGIGISDERNDKIFDKTSYETTIGTEFEKGSGLGLKLCREFIGMHNGKIWAESELGKGSKFCFSIPKN